MKISVINSTLSCTTKCIRFLIAMINKKVILGLFIFSFLGACTSPSAMLGPAYTLTSTGNIYQSSLTYGSSEMITRYTGKTPIENLQKISLKRNNIKNIKKETLESEDFFVLVKNRIEETNKILNKANQ